MRALENAIERSVLLARGPLVEPDDVLGRGAGMRREVPVIAELHDPRREPVTVPPVAERAVPVAHVPLAQIAVPAHAAPTPAQPFAVQSHPAVVMSAVSVPNAAPAAASLPAPAPQAAVLHAPMRPFVVEGSGGATVPMVGGPERRVSNPLFPRQLPDAGVDLFSAVESYQNNLIKQALARTGGNKNRAAQLLGLNRTTLVEMLKRKGL